MPRLTMTENPKQKSRPTLLTKGDGFSFLFYCDQTCHGGTDSQLCAVAETGF